MHIMHLRQKKHHGLTVEAEILESICNINYLTMVGGCLPKVTICGSQSYIALPGRSRWKSTEGASNYYWGKVISQIIQLKVLRILCHVCSIFKFHMAVGETFIR